ncbi:MAG TPA: ThuA domain-containing protein [Candidatus Acidoferrum sp.]|nr:ThuA domain-containing protein [Candidatus Acidoferrum sp.]
MNTIRILLLSLLPLAGLASEPKPIKALLLSGGGYHDYAVQIPLLSSNLTWQAQITFDVAYTLDSLTNAAFARGYDLIVCDFCVDEVKPGTVENLLRAIREGEPAVMIHCAVHSFKKTGKVHEWEDCVGMRSKVHDPFEGFQTEKADPQSRILEGFPEHWRTAGDELYQTIEMTENSQPLLKAKSPRDGRVHVVCWTHTYGKGRVFGTTLGHDLHTSQSPDYILLLSRGMLWACGRLE